MNEFTIEVAGGFGFMLFFTWAAAYILSWVCQWIWAWVDDSKTARRNFIVSSIAKIRGWKETEGGIWLYRKGDQQSDGDGIIIPVILATSLTPVIVFYAFKFYPITLFIVSCFFIAYITRFARRNKKMFDDHAKDKNAHK